MSAEVLSLEPPCLVRVSPLLTVKDLNKSYGKVRAVSSVNLHLYPGEVLGIVGESGSGKSTVLRLLTLEEQPDSGQYALDIPALEGQNLFDLVGLSGAR